MKGVSTRIGESTNGFNESVLREIERQIKSGIRYVDVMEIKQTLVSTKEDLDEETAA